jgi:hypothetical protein
MAGEDFISNRYQSMNYLLWPIRATLRLIAFQPVQSFHNFFAVGIDIAVSSVPFVGTISKYIEGGGFI